MPPLLDPLSVSIVGNGSHTLRSFSYMLDKLTHQYDEASRQLADKNKEICRLEKIVWRRLGDITKNGELMIEKIDQVTNEQVNLIDKFIYSIILHITVYIASSKFFKRSKELSYIAS